MNTHFSLQSTEPVAIFIPKHEAVPFLHTALLPGSETFFLHAFDAMPPSTKFVTKQDFTALNITEYTYFSFPSWLIDPQISLVLSNLAELRNKSQHYSNLVKQCCNSREILDQYEHP